MRKRKELLEIPEEVGAIALSAKEQKKLKQQVSADKRKSARRRDKVARWGGLILLGLMMFLGFLLWVGGEMSSERMHQDSVIVR